jgi:hypothetical protein
LGSTIVGHRIDSYPIRVAITAEVDDERVELWSGRQQELFRKNASARQRTIKQIQACVHEFLSQLD